MDTYTLAMDSATDLLSENRSEIIPENSLCNCKTAYTFSENIDMNKPEAINSIYDTTRFYTMENEVIEENYSILNEQRDVFYAPKYKNTNKDLIIVLSGQEQESELYYIFNNFIDRINTVISAGNHKVFSSIRSFVSEFISETSFESAVNKSYKLLKNGQTIVFPCTNNDFDFFSYINFS